MSDAPRSSSTGATPPSAGWGGDFADAQKDSFAALSESMSFVGVCLMLFALLLCVFAVAAAYSGFVANAIGIVVVSCAYAAMAWWTMSAGRSLSALVRTRGGDIGYLMEAVVQLRRLFGFARGVIIVQSFLIAAAAGIYVWCTMVIDKAARCWAPFW